MTTPTNRTNDDFARRSTEGAETGLTGHVDGANAMIRHEEEMRVTTRRVAAKRVTVRKRAVEEERTITVKVRREEIEVVTEDLGDVEMTNATLAENGGEIVLYEERPVVTTEWVPVERVRVGLTTRTENTHVTDNVDREVIDYQADTARDQGRTDRY